MHDLFLLTSSNTDWIMITCNYLYEYSTGGFMGVYFFYFSSKNYNFSIG